MTVLPSCGLVADNPLDAMRELEAISAIGRTKKPIHHVHVDPPIGHETPELFARHRELYEKEFGLEDAPSFSVRHEKGGRDHEHRVYTIVGADGRCADLSWERARREKISRIIEAEFGLPMIAGKHNKAVIDALRKDGRDDVADAMLAAGLVDTPRPDAVSPMERHIAKRTEVPARGMDADVLSAWLAADSGAEFRSALEDAGLKLAQGTKVVVVFRDGAPESLARILSRAARKNGLASIRKAEVSARLKGIDLPDFVQNPKSGRFQKLVEGRLESSEGDPSRIFTTKGEIDVRPAANEKEALRAGYPARDECDPRQRRRAETASGPIGKERRGRRGSDRDDHRPAPGVNDRREAAQSTSSGQCLRRFRNRIAVIRLRKTLRAFGRPVPHEDKAQQDLAKRSGNRIAAARLRHRLSSCDIRRLRQEAERRADAFAARRAIQREVAAMRLCKATSTPLFEKLRDWLRSPEERLERHLADRFSRAKAIADGVVPQPQWLLNAKHAKSRMALQASATWFAKNDAWAAVASHKEKKTWWVYTPWGRRAWSRKNAHLVSAARSATKRHELVRKRRKVAQLKLRAAENRWKRDPERRVIEPASSEANRYKAAWNKPLVGIRGTEHVVSHRDGDPTSDSNYLCQAGKQASIG